MDRQAAERAIEEFLLALGHPAEGERARTPQLVVQAWAEDLLAGYAHDPATIMRGAAIATPAAAHELVTLRDLSVVTMCPHHLLPAHGYADVVFRPGKLLVGFGAVVAALHALARRLTLQETVGRALVALLMEELGAQGALCRLRLRHSCMLARGARQHRAQVETLAFAGCLSEGGPQGQAALVALGAGTSI